MNMPFGEIKDRTLTMRFSTADFSIALVLNAIKVHVDMIEEMQVVFIGAQTDVIAGPSPVFRPIPVVAHFEYVGKGSNKEILEKVYRVVWQGVLNSFPDETCWAKSKEAYASFIGAQADLLRARIEANKE